MQDNIEDNILDDFIQSHEWARIIAVTGALGSGKTEFVLNLAKFLKQSGKKITIADADIINPYFCIRQLTGLLEQEGFSILNPPENAKWSDMSLINSSVGNAIISIGRPKNLSKNISEHLLIDIGGDAGGVMALKQFELDILSVQHELILVVNAYRPKTSTPDGVRKMADSMEKLCGLKISALISNSHLMESTTAEDVINGCNIVLEAGQNMNLPVLCATVIPELYEKTRSLLDLNLNKSLSKNLNQSIFLCPLTRFMKQY